MKRQWQAAITVASVALATAPAWSEEVTATTVVDRLQIQDLITRYYNNFGRENPENFSDFYADDAELILGTRSFKGKEGILHAYARGPGDAPRKPPERFSFIVTAGNPLKAGTEVPEGWKE